MDGATPFTVGHRAAQVPNVLSRSPLWAQVGRRAGLKHPDHWSAIEIAITSPAGAGTPTSAFGYRMSSVYETTGRLLGEHLDALLEAGWYVEDLLADQAGASGGATERNAQFVRLISAAQSLYWQHAVDAKGRCRICTRRSRLRRTRLRPCTVYSALSFYLTQPDELVLRDIPRPATQYSLPLSPDTKSVILAT